jgi:type I restriction enzyme S subunit
MSSQKLKRLVDPLRPITYGIVQAGPDFPGGIPYVRPVDMTDEHGVLDIHLAALAQGTRKSRS